MKRIKKVIALVLSLLMAATFTGCSSSSSNDTGSPSTAPSSSDSSASSGKVTINIADTYQLDSLDAMNSHSVNAAISYLWSDTLLLGDGLGNFQPFVAESYEFAADNMSCTFKMRDDVTFSNGDKLTSADVAYSMMRPVLDPTLSCARSFQKLKSVDCPDDYTVVFNFTELWPTFLNDLPADYPIFDKKVCEADPDAYFKKPVGSGAYEVTSFDPSTGTATLTKRSDYWAYAAGILKESNVDVFNYKYVSESTTRVSALKAGEVNVIGLVPTDQANSLEQAGFAVNKTDEPRHVFIGLNCSSDSVFADPNLRKAFSEAIDRELLVSSVVGEGTPLTWPVPEGVLGYSADTQYQYNLEDAKNLIKNSSYKGEQISLLVSSGLISRISEVSQAIQSMLLEAGFNASISMVEEASYDEQRSGGKYDAAIGCFNWACNDSFKEIVEIIGGDIFGTHFKSDELSNLISTVSTEVDKVKRDADEKAVYQYVMDNYAPYIYLYSTTGVQAYDKNISGLTIRSEGTFDFRQVQVSK